MKFNDTIREKHHLSGAMRMERIIVQDRFLNEIKINNIVCTVFLAKGFQAKGKIESFDDFCVIVNTDGKQQMIYKHSISTIVPSKPVQLMPPRLKLND